jgi:beta-phosphoglucomutase family hydrolase
VEAVVDRQRHDAVVLDLDGVVTDTASVHEAAWRQLFDAFLAARPDAPGEDHSPFTHHDYLTHVDGRPRVDGARTFLAARGVRLEPDELAALAAAKDRCFRRHLEREGVRVFPGSVDLLARLRRAGLRLAVVSASRNAAAVLAAANLTDVFDTRVDGVTAEELHLSGKPDQAVFLEAARRLGVEAARAVVVEDAEAGVEAGRRGRFGLVVGVDRSGVGALSEHGADVVVGDLAQVRVADGAPR